MLYQAFKAYDLGENRSHALESILRNVESMQDNLERERASAKPEEAPRREQLKRERPAEEDEDDMADAAVGEPIGPPSPTVVADEDDESALQAAETGAAALAPQGGGDSTARAPPTDTIEGASQTDTQPVVVAAAPQEPASAATPGAGARAALRERSPRREADPARARGAVRWADASEEEEEEVPQLTAEQAAALRGDSVGSLPELEEVPPLANSNQRGGASLT